MQGMDLMEFREWLNNKNFDGRRCTTCEDVTELFFARPSTFNKSLTDYGIKVI